jgi:prepilin-type N-terminal cleavage/methylation domain-containing protein
MTLIEILVVMAVIAMLAGMVLVLTLRVENQSSEATVANVSLRCRGHNVYEAALAFGAAASVSAILWSAVPVVPRPESAR